jgi:hypothetical protein
MIICGQAFEFRAKCVPVREAPSGAQISPGDEQNVPRSDLCRDLDNRENNGIPLLGLSSSGERPKHRPHSIRKYTNQTEDDRRTATHSTDEL